MNQEIQQKSSRIKNTKNPEKISRRGFFSSVFGIWSAVAALPVLYTLIDFLSPPRKKFKSSTERLNPALNTGKISLDKLPENSSVYITVDDEPVLLIRGDGDKLKAFSAMCTHLDCLISYRKSEKDIFCNCHGSSFNLEGIPLEGPAKYPLPKYKPEIKNGTVYISPVSIN